MGINPDLDRFSPEHGDPAVWDHYEVMEASKKHSQDWYPIAHRFYRDDNRDEWEEDWKKYLLTEVKTFASDSNMYEITADDIDFHYDEKTKLYFAIYEHGCLIARHSKYEEVKD